MGEVNETFMQISQCKDQHTVSGQYGFLIALNIVILICIQTSLFWVPEQLSTAFSEQAEPLLGQSGQSLGQPSHTCLTSLKSGVGF